MISDMSPKNHPNETISRWFQTVFYADMVMNIQHIQHEIIFEMNGQLRELKWTDNARASKHLPEKGAAGMDWAWYGLSLSRSRSFPRLVLVYKNFQYWVIFRATVDTYSSTMEHLGLDFISSSSSSSATVEFSLHQDCSKLLVNRCHRWGNQLSGWGSMSNIPGTTTVNGWRVTEKPVDVADFSLPTGPSSSVPGLKLGKLWLHEWPHVVPEAWNHGKIRRIIPKWPNVGE